MSLDRQIAVALGYRPGTDVAPRVLATGRGVLAQRILETAVRHGVPIESDAHLAGWLAEVPLQDEIPEELYPAIAEILAFLLEVGSEVTPETAVARDPK